MRADLIKWRNKAANRLRLGKSAAVKFKSDAIPTSLQGAILGSLEAAENTGDVTRIFHNAMTWGQYP
jgi:hypothetical protein